MTIMDFLRTWANIPLYKGGNGASEDEAVIINTSDPKRGVLAEYEYISQECGEEGVDWTRSFQMLIGNRENGKRYDLVCIKTRDGDERTFYFDINKFFGKY